ncbi:MAG: protein-L-isoaspartate(D-aspartate) O-methyltransferase [Planctomycetes bacterium]|nr:protein-L-isoaspartate(D-aspartate) O-methyltransferase [Planctomycetota bacterium]
MVREQLGDCADQRVAAAMAALPRHWFVPPEIASHAYDDCALAIGSEQTISQPRVVASMLTSLRLAPGSRVLDVGAGSGYAAALIARLVEPEGLVIAIERQGALVAETRRRLGEVAPRVRLVLGDGLAGFPESAPFDAIHVACACETVPAALVDQLAEGGRLIAPVGAHGSVQRLLALTRIGHRIEREDLGGVLFVPGLPGVVG